MLRTSVVAIALCLVASASLADRLELLDGRTFVGSVTIMGEAVSVKMTYGTLQFAKSEVRKIVFKETPDEELTRRLAAMEDGDTDGLLAMAIWANSQNLPTRSTSILNRIIKLDADHAEARRRLGFVKIDAKWQAFPAALEVVRGKLQAGQCQPLLAEILPAMAILPLNDADKMAVQDMLARAQLRTGKFAQATHTFASLAEAAKGLQAFRYAAITGILGSRPDGMYVLTEPYPPSAGLLGNNGQSLKAGPVSLSNPLALEAALRDSAKVEIQAGRKLLDEAREAEPTQPQVARNKLTQATKRFNQADALVADIARSYHIEIIRRRIVSNRKVIEADARKYEQVNTDLGNEKITPKEYHTVVVRMIHHLDNVRDGLKDILTVAKPYPRELVLEIKWAELDLESIAKMRDVLVEERDGER